MKLKWAIFLVIMASACKDPFSPEVDPSNKDLLVVEGHLTIGGLATFTLSRSGDLQEREARKPEASAKVLIEENGNVVVQGSSGKDGVCMLFTHNLELSKKYRLRIIRTNGKIYETDYLESKITPEIDSVNYKAEGNGFKIYLNTHDAKNSTKFYSWNYHETWEIVSPVISYWELKGGGLVERDQNINIRRCWQQNTSSSIMLGSTERLKEDRISLFPLTFVQGNSIRLAHMYSILVKQYALTREAYQYLEIMKKNTEQIGTIFDPQPSELRGNIRCVTNPKEAVVGWITAGTVAEKRIFIKPSERLIGWGKYHENCGVKKISKDSVLFYLLKDSLVEDRHIFFKPLPPPIMERDTSYTVAHKLCVDCTLRGSNIKPSYWPN